VNTYRKLAVAIAGLTLSFAAIEPDSVHAAVITYDFRVDLTTGSLANNTYEGSFNYDDSTLTGIGVEAVGVTEGLFILFNFFGETYTQTDELSFPNFPIAVFNNGNLVGLNYLVADFDNSLDDFSIFSIFGDDTTLLNAGNQFSYQVNSFDSFEGNVTYSLDSPSTSIPEPDGVLGVSLLGIAWLLNRAITFSHHAQITRLRRKTPLI
jgi:hypothetical protein